MTLPLLLALLVPPVTRVPETIDAPAGLSSEFLGLFQAVKAAEPAKAARLARRLPKEEPTVFWDESQAPAAVRPLFRDARDYAIAQWSKMLPEFRPRLVASKAAADIVIDFAPKLARDAGATFFFSEASDEPRLETVIGLQRIGGKTSSTDVHNEIAYTFGTYLGLLPSLGFGGAMGRTDERAQVVVEIDAHEAATARQALQTSKWTREKLAQKAPLGTGTPDLWVEKPEVALGEVEQGGAAETKFQIANRGTSPLLLTVAGDCACLGAVGPTRLAPGETGLVRAKYATAVLGGAVDHTVLLRTNDPQRPLVRVPIHLKVRPVVRFVRPEGLLQIVEGDEPFEAYILVSGDQKLLVDQARVLGGFPIEATFTPWSGEIADPAMNEGPRRAKGYKLRAIPKDVPFGRTVVAVEIPTADPNLKLVRFNYTVQRGIVAAPASVYFGDLGPETEPITIRLSRPKKPFRIVGASSPHPGVTAKVLGGKGETVEIFVSVDRTRIEGSLQTVLILTTDDPAQPRIELPVLANLG